MVTKRESSNSTQGRTTAAVRSTTPRDMVSSQPKGSTNKGQAVYCNSYKTMKKS